MKRTLLAAALVLTSGAALANDLPQPSFNDGSTNVAAQRITSNRTVDNNFPKAGTPMGGPQGPATILLQSLQTEAVYHATVVAPSFSG
jgi:hypothetical protein